MSVSRWVGTNGNNCWQGRNGQRPQLIANHVMLGTLQGTWQEFRTPGTNVSATYGLGRDGTILQFVNENDTAFANGPIRAPNRRVVPLIDWCDRNNVNPNRLTISIEWEGAHAGGLWVPVHTSDGSDLLTIRRNTIVDWWTPPPDQLAAGIQLIREIAGRWNIPRDRAHICRHSDFDSETKWFCPGEGFPLQEILDALGRT